MQTIINTIRRQIENKRILLIGTGGGNDIFSSILTALFITKHGKPSCIDIAGMTSPAAFHTYNGHKEKTINEIDKNTVVVRTLQDKSFSQKSFVDHKIHEAINFCKNTFSETININCVYHFSTLYGSIALSKDVNNLIRKNKYDIVIGVDVGGDILAGFHVNSVLSPLMDMTCLYVLDNVNVPSYILEFGYGTDGESGNKCICDNLRFYKNCKLNCIEDDIDVNSEEFYLFKDMFYKIIYPIRPGHTIPLFIKSCESKEKVITDIHNYRYRLGDLIVEDKFDVTIHAPFNKAYLFETKTICEINRTNIAYSSVLKHACYLKQENKMWASEIDMQVLSLMDKHILFGVISVKFDMYTRNRFYQSILQYIGSKYDCALVFRKDILDFGIDDIMCCDTIYADPFQRIYDIVLIYRGASLDEYFLKSLKNLFNL